MLQHIGHPDSPQYKHILQNVMVPSVQMLCPDGINHLQQDHSSIHDSRVVQERLSLQTEVNSLTGRRERLIWIPSRICGVSWRGQCRKPGLSSLPEIVMSYGTLCQTGGMKLLRLRVTFDPFESTRHDEWNQWSKHRGSGLLIKEASFWKQPL